MLDERVSSLKKQKFTQDEDKSYDILNYAHFSTKFLICWCKKYCMSDKSKRHQNHSTNIQVAIKGLLFLVIGGATFHMPIIASYLPTLNFSVLKKEQHCRTMKVRSII